MLAFAPTLPVGRALDLGCGLGRATIFLARLGWQADGVDFIAQAVAEATRRAQLAGVAARAHFYHGAVDQLDFLAGPYDFALDVGCAHNRRLPPSPSHHRSVTHQTTPAGEDPLGDLDAVHILG